MALVVGTAPALVDLMPVVDAGLVVCAPPLVDEDVGRAGALEEEDGAVLEEAGAGVLEEEGGGAGGGAILEDAEEPTDVVPPPELEPPSVTVTPLSEQVSSMIEYASVNTSLATCDDSIGGNGNVPLTRLVRRARASAADFALQRAFPGRTPTPASDISLAAATCCHGSN